MILLGPESLDQRREPGRKPFAEPAAGLPEKGVLGRLLADRRAAPNDPAPLGILPHRLRDRIDVEAAMAAEFAVLAGDHGALHVVVDLADRHPVLFDLMPIDQVADHREGDRRRHEARSEEHTSELQSLMRLSYAVFC